MPYHAFGPDKGMQVRTFSWNHNWLMSNFICPDIIGLMSQYNSFPWDGGNYKMNDDGTTTKILPDNRNCEEIAYEIVNVKVMEEMEVDDFYKGVVNKLKMNQSSGHRYNFMVESPVPGSYFGSI